MRRSRVLPTGRELVVATLAVLLALTVTNLFRTAQASEGGPTGDVAYGAAATFPTPGLYPIAMHASGDHEQFKEIKQEAEIVLDLPEFTAPTNGTMIVTASLTAGANAGNVITCSISKGLGIDNDASWFWGPGPVFAARAEVMAGTRGFDLTAGQSISVRLVCEATDYRDFAGVRNSALTAVFYPDIVPASPPAVP